MGSKMFKKFVRFMTPATGVTRVHLYEQREATINQLLVKPEDLGVL